MGDTAQAGVSDHAGWAAVVCVAGDEVVLRRRIELIEPGLPCMPHHHEAQHLPLDEGVALIGRVRASAARCAAQALDELPAGVRVLCIRERPTLPPTLPERIASYWAQCRADSVMYRDVLAEAAEARGWTVVEYAPKTVVAEAGEALGLDMAVRLKKIGERLGPPWAKDQRLAAAAAYCAAPGVRGD